MSTFQINDFLEKINDYHKSILISIYSKYELQEFDVKYHHFVEENKLDKTSLLKIMFDNMSIKLNLDNIIIEKKTEPKTNTNINYHKKKKRKLNIKKYPIDTNIESKPPKKYSQKNKNKKLVVISSNYNPNKSNKKLKIKNPITSNPITSNPIPSNPITSNPITSNPITSNPILNDYINDYDYFAHACKELNLDYYKYNLSQFWQGPALILDKHKHNQISIKKIKESITINLSTDILPNDYIAIYPKNKYDPNTISYNKYYDSNTPLDLKNEDKENIEVIEWEFNNHIYLLDKYTDTIYDFDSEMIIGKRHYNYNKREWSICNE